jgi:hypothetical protein
MGDSPTSNVLSTTSPLRLEDLQGQKSPASVANFEFTPKQEQEDGIQQGQALQVTTPLSFASTAVSVGQYSPQNNIQNPVYNDIMNAGRKKRKTNKKISNKKRKSKKKISNKKRKSNKKISNKKRKSNKKISNKRRGGGNRITYNEALNELNFTPTATQSE